MSEPVKCPHCEDGKIYERGSTEQYYGVYRNDDGETFIATVAEGEYYEMDCYTCLDCGWITNDDILEIIDRGDA